jgi:WD40 repeat protein
VRVWDAESGEKLEDHPVALRHDDANPERAVGLSAGAAYLAGRDPADERVVRVWDASTGATRALCRGHSRPVRSVALSADGAVLATAAADASANNPGGVPAELVLWDAGTGRELRRLPAPAPWPDALAFSADGRRLAASFRRFLDTGLRLGPDSPGEIRVWDLPGGEPVCRIEAGAGMFAALAFNPAGDCLAGAGYHKGVVHVWEVAGGAEVFRRPFATTLTGVAFSPDGGRLAVTGFDGLVRLLDADSGMEALTLAGLGRPGSGHYNFTARVAFSPDGRRLAASNWDGTVSVWDAGPDYRSDARP